MNPVLVIAARLESGETPHVQTISVGHHQVTCDEPKTRGGGDLGPSPTGLVLAGLAGCTSITLRMYADRKGWQLGSVHVEAALYLEGETQRIERTISFGAELAPEQRARLLEIAGKTPVTRMLQQGVAIATRLR
jgi:putative redox protein